MSGNKNTGLFKGLLTVLILSIVVYFVIFLFFPNVSLKYFGIAFNKEKAIEKSVIALMDRADYLLDDEKEKVEEYLSSKDGEDFVKEISSAINDGIEGIKSFTDTDTFRNFEKKMSEILSSESYRKLTENIEEVASSILKNN